MVQGEQGSAKSTACRVLRLLIDPHSTPLRTVPRSPRDLMITANGTWLVALDNLSGVQRWLSDALCRLATGGGFATRSLYSDEEETHFNAMRPILLNGIDDLADREDLLDRAILFACRRFQRIRGRRNLSSGPTSRRTGRLSSGLSSTLSPEPSRLLPDVHLDRSPRMADFARFGEAVGRSQGWGDGAFLQAYKNNIDGVTEAAAEASPVATAILQLMDDRRDHEWQGTTGELFTILTGQLNDRAAKSKCWPQSPRALSSELTRLAPVLRRLDVSYTQPNRATKSRKLLLVKASSLQAPQAQQAPAAVNPCDSTVYHGACLGAGMVPVSPATVPETSSEVPVRCLSPQQAPDRHLDRHRDKPFDHNDLSALGACGTDGACSEDGLGLTQIHHGRDGFRRGLDDVHDDVAVAPSVDQSREVFVL